MILTCPECATSYFVDDSRISAAGRTVKCSNCGARWTALKDDPAEPAAARAPPARKPEPAPDPTAFADDLVVEGPEAAPFAPAAKTRATGPRGEAAGKVLVWAVSAAVIVVLVGAATVFRAQVVRLIPASQAAYAGLGLPVNGPGLAIEAVRVEPAFQGGRPVLAVTGVIRNVGDTDTTAPDVRVSLLDGAGKTLAARIARPIDPRVPAHALRHFALAIVDPPAGVHDLEVTFEAPARKGATHTGAKAGRAAPPAAEAATPMTLAPIEARPLPAGSPDALPAHD